MEIFKSKIIIFFIILFFCGCDDGILAINSEKPLYFSTQNGNLKLNGSDKFGLIFITKECGACKEQLIYLKEINFKFIAVLGDAKDMSDALNVAKEINFPVVFDKDSVMFLSNAVGCISGVPATFLFNDDLSKKFLGLTPKSVIEKEIKKL
ncbi:TlpA family protein disulfide reductase [Campylobacter corcagiensis]|uniref:Thioredoxin n=1 Tax=Campylobacter corcagiensis TaxID=1448857 RepID=A0A7M1LEX6_9BACT|nr:hypothetical protein [Campylobacter corcagiensis]QKF64703.1 protein disulfide reductase, TlpA family [Campylobacter corcagiensis]QOQ87132.1 thioredoxin [Campylobacter corcagiensis]